MGDMKSKSVVTVSRKWSNPNILVWVNDEEIGMGMKLDDFINSMALETINNLSESIAANIGNPTLLITQSQLKDKILSAVTDVLLVELKLAATNVEQEMRDKSAVAV